MPAIQPPAKVLVTGANGYVAIWVVKTLLDKGYSVRGTVRSQEKAKHLDELFKPFGDKYESVIVPDITADGAFDKAVQGVDVIEHTASPFHLHAKEPEEMIDPAVKGTVGVLKSALAHAPDVKRIVITASVASVTSVLDEPTFFTEQDWNNQSVEWVERDGNKAHPGVIYQASKTLAEKAAWDFWKANKDKVKWDLVCLNPPFVFGPTIHEVSSPEQLNTSAKVWYDAVARADSGGMPQDVLSGHVANWIDVRDLGLAHMLAIEKEAAGGERIIISNGPFSWQDMIDAANSASSTYKDGKIAKGSPGSGTKTHKVNFRTDKEEKIFAIKKRSMAELAKDTLDDLQKKGW